ncbi:hypothetical protein MASR2M15_07930 [Anaerolineales bacterium]
MRLVIDGQERELGSLAAFRQAHQLGAEFGIQSLSEKDFEGLAILDGHNHQHLGQIEGALMKAVAAQSEAEGLLDRVDTLQSLFQSSLLAINDEIGLKLVEVEFAEAGFGDMLRLYAYEMIRSRALKQAAPDFDVIYRRWLDDSVQLSTPPLRYPYQDEVWELQTIHTHYGRSGLKVRQANGQIDYLMDGRFACPADGFMQGLLRKVCQALAGSSA